jgi:hypothetical protein
MQERVAKARKVALECLQDPGLEEGRGERRNDQRIGRFNQLARLVYIGELEIPED